MLKLVRVVKLYVSYVEVILAGCCCKTMTLHSLYVDSALLQCISVWVIMGRTAIDSCIWLNRGHQRRLDVYPTDLPP